VLARFAGRTLEDHQERDSKHFADRLLSLKQIAERMNCSAQTVTRGVKTGQYPFMFKNGQHWVGSEEGLERWIEARVKRQRMR
jgi:predicted DNA-binding transcriptional regulator AlpA